jgi:hypothetical protein
MKVFAFDRDMTVDVRSPRSQHLVPLEWVSYLAHETEHEVWAIGNQQLTEEAEIPGIAEAIDRHSEYTGPVQSVSEYPREERVRIVGELSPTAEERLVIDDADLSGLDGWRHYYPREFIAAVVCGILDVDPPTDEVESGRKSNEINLGDVWTVLRLWLRRHRR